MGAAYVNMGLMSELYVLVSVSLSCPQLVPASACRMRMRDAARVLMLSVCCLKVSILSKVTPSIVVVRVCGMSMSPTLCSLSY